MPYYVGILMFYMNPYDTFKCFTNLLVSNRFLHALYSFNLEEVYTLLQRRAINIMTVD